MEPGSTASPLYQDGLGAAAYVLHIGDVEHACMDEVQRVARVVVALMARCEKCSQHDGGMHSNTSSVPQTSLGDDGLHIICSLIYERYEVGELAGWTVRDDQRSYNPRTACCTRIDTYAGARVHTNKLSAASTAHTNASTPYGTCEAIDALTLQRCYMKEREYTGAM